MTDAAKPITTYPENAQFVLQAYTVRRHDAGVVFDLHGLTGETPDPDNPDDRAVMVVGMSWPRLKEFAALVMFLVGQHEADTGVIVARPRRGGPVSDQVH